MAAAYDQEIAQRYPVLSLQEGGGGKLGDGGANRGGDPRANAAALKAAEVNAVFYESPATGYEWLAWRRSLHPFAPLLFKN